MDNKIITFNTERLIIRKTKLEDVDLLLKMDKQEITQLYLGGIKNKTREERIIFLEKKIEKSKNDILGALTVCLLNKTPIGFIEFNTKDNYIEISYIFDYEYCNKGYCTEACQKLIDVSFNQLNIKKIYAKTIKDNNSSKKVLYKLGFKPIKQNNIKEENNTFLEYELIK